ncbi:MAG: signal peptide peptidase SppA, partial [Spirochaetales bacterium]|nr:signal peptide peptidase SppA [Spirochaetales bacterium]
SSDSKITDMILDLDSFAYAGFGSLEEIGNALKIFKDSGKQIYTFSSFYNRESYYLASFANNITIDPLGELNINGISSYRNYWKDFIDKFNIDVSIFRAGEFKSYVEPYLNNSMSTGVKEQNLVWMNSLWNNYISDIKKNININPLTFNEYFNSREKLLKRYSGDSALMAQETGFVHNIESREVFFSRFLDVQDFISYNQKNISLLAKDGIAVVTIEGVITYSDNSPGNVSAVDVVTLLDSINPKDYNGLIVRINSGGGGVFASEIIRRKITEFKDIIPVVISMGDVCASGGYWIASAGDYIFADSNTITGSIGVFGLVYGLSKAIDETFEIHSDGVSTSKYSQNNLFSKNLTEEEKEIFQLSVENIYNKFIDIVSKSRGMDPSNVRTIAEGKVWSGKNALEIGLIDSIGGITDAANYIGGNLLYIDGEKSLIDSLVDDFSNLIKFNGFKNSKAFMEIDTFSAIDDPKNIYALWF